MKDVAKDKASLGAALPQNTFILWQLLGQPVLGLELVLVAVVMGLQNRGSLRWASANKVPAP